MMFDFLRPVASANLTTDFSGSGHSSIRRFASSFSSHLTRLFLTAGILMTGAFSSHFQSRSAARRILATFPASLANRDQNELNEIRRQWVLAFRENGITTMEQVNAGMRVARRQNRPFLPSPGQFVAWCREEASVNAGLPNVSELVDMVYEYCRKRGLYPDAESYPWKSNAHYWLVTNLYQNMRANALADAELRRKAADELTCMTARINRGETIPEPVKQLPVMGGRPLNRAQALAKIAEIKAKFGLKGASV